MNLRSLTPSGNGGTRMSPSVNPFGFLHREIDRIFEDLTRGTPDVPGPAQVTLVPSIDVTETDDAIAISAEMPGLERNDVEITVEDDVLTIRGEKKVDREEGDENKYHLSERSYGVFVRVMQLPSGIDPSQIEASMANGVLRIVIPKPSRSQPKKIEVKEAASPQAGQNQGRNSASSRSQTDQGQKGAAQRSQASSS
jgi:HSP20 family protein